MLTDIYSNQGVEQLAGSPLLLTMLALLRRHVGKLPDRRVELYQQYVRTLIDNWEVARSAGARQRAINRFDPHTAIAHLIELALWLQKHKPSGTARRAELETALTEICLRYEGHETATAKQRVKAAQTVAMFLKDMRHFAGLLAERGRDAFGFLHLTFQEYFAGRALARLSPEERWQVIQTHLHQPRWQEPILLCAGQLGVIEQRRELVSQLVDQILDNKSRDESLLHRDIFLTVAIMSDNVGLNNVVLSRVHERLIQLTASHVPIIQKQAWQGLTELACIGYTPTINFLMVSIEKSITTPKGGGLK